MSTAALAHSIEVVDAVETVPVQDTSELDTRWGFQMSQRDKILNALEFGVSIVPFARFFPITSKRLPRENHTTDDTKPKEVFEIVPAAHFEKMLMEVLGGTAAQSRVNWGLKTAFHGEDDAAKMAVISATLIPTLSQIREISAEFGREVISEVCEGRDELDFGDRESCITCFAKWLNSDVVKMHMEQVSLTGMTVTERDRESGETVERVVKPTFKELQTALETMQASTRQGIADLQSQWSDIASEYEKADGIRKDITAFEHGYRKDLHQTRPQDRQFTLAREMARGVAGAVGQAQSAPAVDPTLINRLTEVTIQNAEIAADNNRLLRHIAETTVPAQQTVEPQSEDSAPGGKTKDKGEIDHHG